MTISESNYDILFLERRRMKVIEQITRRKAWTFTAIVMAILIVILILVRLPPIHTSLVKSMEADLGSVGLFGNGEEGMNNTYAALMIDGENLYQAQFDPLVQDPMLTENDPDAPVIGERPLNANAANVLVSTNNTDKSATARQLDKNSLYEDNVPGGEDVKAGQQSKGTGTNLSDMGPVTGSVEYISGEFDDGTIINVSMPGEREQVFGIIVVQITVDRSGKVFSATGGAKGTTVTDERVIEQYERNLIGKYIATPVAPDGPERRIGKIKYKLSAN